jgi:hypothetical protein
MTGRSRSFCCLWMAPAARTCASVPRTVCVTDDTPSVDTADTDVYREATLQGVTQTNRMWISRVPETSTEAKAACAQRDDTWNVPDDGNTHGISQIMSVLQGHERLVHVSTSTSQQRAQTRLQHQVTRAQAAWEKTLAPGHSSRCL